MAEYVVPKLCPNGPAPNYPPAYNTLSHGQDYMCGGYFSMKGAYPGASCKSCNATYIKRPCAGSMMNQCTAPAPAPVVQKPSTEGYCGSCSGNAY